MTEPYDRDPSITVVEVRTHRPDDYELIDYREQMRWVLKDGRWVERELPEHEPGAWHYTQPIEVLDLAYDAYMDVALRLERGDPMNFVDLALANIPPAAIARLFDIAITAYRQAHEKER